MVKENIAKFFGAAMTDKALAEKLAALAAESGFVITAAELLELGPARPIVDADMENAAGGIMTVGIHSSEEEIREFERKWGYTHPKS